MQPGGRRFDPGQLHQHPPARAGEASRTEEGDASARPSPRGEPSGGVGPKGLTPLRVERARGSLTTEDPYFSAKENVVHDYSVSSSVNAVVKLLRAYGGCLGAGRR